MVPVRSFVMHFNLLLKLKGNRNVYNEKFRTLRYQIVSFLIWVLLIPLKILDIIGFYFLVDFIRSLTIKARRLTKYEKFEVEKVFAKALNLNQIKIYENSRLARLGAKSAGKRHIGFVLFRTVNFTRPLDHSKDTNDIAWLIHELVHVLQFEHIGVQYIFEALRAQKNGGYSYGGVSQLKRSTKLSEFNLEQQADIARDYYNALIVESENADIFTRYVEEMKAGKF